MDERRGWLEALAIELAELRLWRHVEEHGCGRVGGMANCPLAVEYMAALPEWWFVALGNP